MPAKHLEKAVPLVLSVLGLLEGVSLSISRITIGIRRPFLSVLDFHVIVRIRSSLRILHIDAIETHIVLTTFR